MARKTEQEIYRGRVNPDRVAAYRISHPQATEKEARAALRGHGKTAEHGELTAVKAYEHLYMFETRSGQAARSLLAGAAKQGQTVSIEIFTKIHNETPLVYIERGKPADPKRPEQVDAKWLTIDKANPDRVGSERNLKKWLEKQWMPASGVESPGFQPRNITRIRIFIHFQ